MKHETAVRSGRLAAYLAVFRLARARGVQAYSSQEVSAVSGVNATQIRRDLSTIGKTGKRGVGYNPEAMIDHLSAALQEAGPIGGSAAVVLASGSMRDDWVAPDGELGARLAEVRFRLVEIDTLIRAGV